MRFTKKYFSGFSYITAYVLNWVIVATLLLTFMDVYVIYRWLMQTAYLKEAGHLSKSLIVFVWLSISIIINAFLNIFLFYRLINISEKKHPLLARISTVVMYIGLIAILVFVRYFIINEIITNHITNSLLPQKPMYLIKEGSVIDFTIIKCLLILIIQLSYQVGKKYTPGFFISVVLGRYSNPRIEQRIIMFIDLKDSTPISEKLGHQKYFLFIREFINDISKAALLNRADIYQYVGDEVIVTWPKQKKNNDKCIKTLILCTKHLHTKGNYYRTEFGIMPEFRVGIHVGEITVGEIGLLKKDIAMSGEAMNTAARIRSACSELNQKYIVSKDYFDYTNLKEWQGSDLGEVPLKGLEKKQIILYALKM